MNTTKYEKANQKKQTLAQRYMLPRKEQRRKQMFYKVLQEELGRFLSIEMPENARFDWEVFKEDFANEYQNFTSDELLEEILLTTPKFVTEQAVINRYNELTKETKNKIANFESRNRNRYAKSS